MKSIIILLVLTSLVLSQRKPNKTSQVVKLSTLQSIKSNASWEPYPIHENPFKNYTKQDLSKILGAELTWDKQNIMMLVDADDHNLTSSVPESFDSRTQWPECITPIRNQEHCGSCWAFSAATALSDRHCIASNGKTKVVLSPQFMVSCDKKNMACQGGMLDKTWNFLETTGTVSDKCMGYKSGDGKNVPTCPSKCDDASAMVSYKAVKGSSKPLTCALQMQNDIMSNGPVQTGFMVYEDFMHYKSGVYKYTSGKNLGGHAVRVVGWGKENDVSYWIVANSWGPTWAENGFFRIAFGECLFEANAYSGLADISSVPRLFLKE